MKALVARSNTRLRFIFGLKVKSKLSSVLWASRKPACFLRRSSKRSERRVSSSEIRHEIRSMGAMDSTCACLKRVSSTAAIPPKRSWPRARCSSMRFIWIILLGGLRLGLRLRFDSAFDDIAIQRELANQRIDLTQSERRRSFALEITANETIVVHLDLDRCRASIVHRGRAVFPGQCQNALNAAHSGLAVLRVHGLAQNADPIAGALSAPQQLLRRERCLLLAVFGKDAMCAARLTQVLAQQLSGVRMEQANSPSIPLHLDPPADPAGRRAVVSRFDFHAAIHMNRAFAVLVIAEWLDRKRQQSGFLFREHGRHLAFGGAVDACVRPVLLPSIQVGLCFWERFEALSFQRRLLRVTDAGLHLALAIRILDAAGHGDRVVVAEHVPIERMDHRIVDVRLQYAFAQIVEDQHPRRAAEPGESGLVHLGPDACAGSEDDQPDALA